MEQTFGSKPLGYYVPENLDVFRGMELVYGNHLERMGREAKLELRAVLTAYLYNATICSRADLKDCMQFALEAVNVDIYDNQIWYDLIMDFVQEDEQIVESFIQALGDQLRLDGE